MPASPETLRDLVIANRILAHEGVVDSFGHVSVRHPGDRERYLLSWARAPEMIEAEDIVEFRLDGDGIDLNGRRPYGERMIHGAIYELRDDVNAVIHNHSYEVIPFASTGVPLRPVMHTCGVIGEEIPSWDIRDKFGEGDHLVVTMDQGRDLGATLGDRSIALMKRHGCVVVGASLQEAVMKAVYLQVNAKLQMQAMQIGTPDYLTPKEIEASAKTQLGPLGLERTWEAWCRRAMPPSS
jgi:ribulose-5-phosphate 4-epimerase/fuculose-1-phosphate aldolase